MTVRIATQTDEGAIYDLLAGPEGLHADNGVGVGFSPVKVWGRIRTATEGRGGIIGLIDGDHEIAASVGLFFDSPWYSDTVYLAELWLYVRPVYRSRGYAAELFGFAKECRQKLAEGSGEPLWLMTSVVSRKRLGAKMKYWARHADLIGGIYVVDGGPNGVR